MNWKDCITLLNDYRPSSRFIFPENISDFDCDRDVLTASDVGGFVSWLWTFPGDWLLSQEPFLSFFELNHTVVVGMPASSWLPWGLLFICIWLMSLLGD